MLRRKSIAGMLVLSILMCVLFSFRSNEIVYAGLLPSPWLTCDVGNVGVTGSASFEDGVFTGVGAGADIYGSADALRYIYQNVTGDTTIIARVTAQQNTDWYAKAGIAVRETTASGSKYFGILRCPSNSIGAQWRTATDNWTDGTSGGTISLPTWFKIVRTGNSFSGYTSTNGTTWTLVTTQTISMSSNVTVGMVVCSHVAGTVNTSNFDNVSVNGQITQTPTPSPSPTPIPETEHKLTLTTSMVTNESGTGNAQNLVDEQVLAGDTPSGTCISQWFPGDSATYPQSAYIDLGQNYVITKIYLYDSAGSGSFVVSSGAPGSWNQLFTDGLIPYNSWTVHNVNATTRYIRCTMQVSTARVNEIVIYGYQAGGTVTPTPTATPTPTPTPTATPTPTPPPGTPGVITLNPSMIIDETAYVGNNYNSAVYLVDEQNLAGDPPTAAAQTKWNVEYNTVFYPLKATIDLGQTYIITKIYLYDGGGDYPVGSPGVSVSAGTPFQWTLLFSDRLTGYNSWNQHNISGGFQTRYIHLERPDDAPVINEIVVCGYLAPVQPSPTPTPVPRVYFNIPVEKSLGTNIFVDDPIDKIAVGGFNREYHNWVWDSTSDPTYTFPNVQYKFNPSYGNYPYWSFDSYYLSLKNAGLEVYPCLQQSVPYLTGIGNNGFKPIRPGSNPELPSSYIEHADYVYQFAARYGSTAVDTSLLKLANDQVVATGLNYIKYLENWNEQDSWWDNRDVHFTPSEYAAMCSADYDGHEGTMGTTVGMKNADPNIKMVMGGLAEGTNLNYLKAMKFWFDHNRSDGKFVPDVINLHDYCTDNVTGLSPEEDNLKAKWTEVANWVHTNLPDKELWVSEIGWDTNVGSRDSAPSLEAQANWSVRAVLELYAAGVDRVQLFMLRDAQQWDGNGNVYMSSGLVTRYGQWNPKPSWYYVYTMKNRLTGMKYLSEQQTNNNNVRAYKFKNLTGNNGAYVLWCPTTNGTTVSNYKLTLPNNATTATLVTMANGDTDGIPSTLTITNHTVTVNVSERPIYVLVNNIQ